VLHRNARLTVHGRALLVSRVLTDRRPVAHVAKELGISRQCAHRWVRRYRAEGPAGLHDRSSRPRTSPRRTSTERETAVITARRELRTGPTGIAAATGVPARTVTRILTRHRLPPLRALDPLTGQLIRATRLSAQRYEHPEPGSLIHLDVKKLGRIPDGGGWKAHGRATTHADKRRRPPIGFDYIHAAVDDHSRYAYAEVLPDEKAATCAAFLTRAAHAFAAAGITHIQRVITDNAFTYRRSYAFRDAVTAIGARQKFIKPHCPWTNGKVERFNRTLATEWAYRQPYTSNQHRTDTLTTWLECYNTTRPHHALDGRPPISRLSPT
jgi:transposase InsO family protein